MKKLLLILCVICLCLCACGQEPVEAEPVSVPEPVEEPEQEDVPAPESPKPKPEPEPEPLPEMTAGDPVVIDGTWLGGGSVMIEGSQFVRMREAAEALNADLQWDPVIKVIRRDGKAAVRPEIQPVEVLGELWIPMNAIPGLGTGHIYDAETACHYFTTAARDFEIPADYKVPILMYHAVSDDIWSPYPDLFVSPASMEEQLKYLQDNGYTTIFFSDLEYIDQIEKPVLLTFDDGYLDNYAELFPLLKKYNAKATVFVVTKSLDTHPLYMTWEQAREMADSGLVDIQSHTYSHPDLNQLTYEEQQFELQQSKLDILRNLGRESYVFCYPSGRYSHGTMAIMEGLYHFGIRMDGGDYYTQHDPLQVNRWFVHRRLDLGVFADMCE